MRNVLTIAGREIKSYFVSPIAYVVLTGFLLLGGWFFFNLLARFNLLLTIYSAQQNPQVLQRLNLNEFVIAPLLHNLSVVLVILVRVLLSWVQVRLPGGLGELVFGVSEPILGPIRRALPSMGGFDLSPLVAFFAIRFIQDVILRLLPPPV